MIDKFFTFTLNFLKIGIMLFVLFWSVVFCAVAVLMFDLITGV